MRDYIKTIGLYRNKAKNVIALSEKLIAEFGGEVPRTRAEIESLPGAGRKTANVVLNMAFGEHTMAVDTHVFRVGNRTGLAPGKTPLEVELGLERVIPGRIHAARASLADPARPLHVPGPQAALRDVPDQRSLPLAGKDGVSFQRASRLRRREDASLHQRERPIPAFAGSINSGRGPAQALVHVDHEGHAEQRRRQVDDRDRDEGRDDQAGGEDRWRHCPCASPWLPPADRNRIAASSKYSRPNSHAVAMKNAMKPTPAKNTNGSAIR